MLSGAQPDFIDPDFIGPQRHFMAPSPKTGFWSVLGA
jgi:hypothetical protein